MAPRSGLNIRLAERLTAVQKRLLEEQEALENKKLLKADKSSEYVGLARTIHNQVNTTISEKEVVENKLDSVSPDRSIETKPELAPINDELIHPETKKKIEVKENIIKDNDTTILVEMYERLETELEKRLSSMEETLAKFSALRGIQAATSSGGGAGKINDLTDVDLSGIADGQILSYSSTTKKFTPVADGGAMATPMAIALGG